MAFLFCIEPLKEFGNQEFRKRTLISSPSWFPGFQINPAFMIASKDSLDPNDATPARSSDYVMPNRRRVYLEGGLHLGFYVPPSVIPTAVAESLILSASKP